MPEDTVSIRIRLRDALGARKDADQVANAVDNIGEQADQTRRKLDRMNISSSRTAKALAQLNKASSEKVRLGPFSTSLRAIPFWAGGAGIAIEKLTPQILSLTEAAATLAGGGGAAGGVGLLALGQAAGVAKLGLTDLTAALGGNRAALKRLPHDMRPVFRTLRGEMKQLRREADKGMLPGLTQGAKSALRNRGVFNQIAGETGRTLGGLASDAGGMLGSKAWGRDLATVGRSNTKIIGDLGHAGLNLADAFRHVAVEASPLARWLAQDALQGSRLVDVWARNARASGEMTRFFHEARTELSLLASIGGHTGRGIINLFGSQDVDGTRTLRNFDRLTGDFERWTRNPATRRNVGDAIVAEIPKAVGAVMTAVANNLPHAGALGAETFIRGFMHADVWGKLLAGGFLANKLGLFKLGKNLLTGGGITKGGKGGLLGAMFGGARGSSPANPLFVSMVGSKGVPGTGGGGGTSLWNRIKGGVDAAVTSALVFADKAPRVAGGAIVGAGAVGANELDKLVTHMIFGQPNVPGNPLFGPNNARAMIDHAVRNAIHGPGGSGGAMTGGPFGNGTLHATFRVQGREIARADTTAQAKLRARRAGG